MEGLLLQDGKFLAPVAPVWPTTRLCISIDCPLFAVIQSTAILRVLIFTATT
jgi:hypothetical protein